MPRLYAKIPHLPGSRTGPRDRHASAALVERLIRAARSGDRILVQEKLDGSCVAVARRAGAIVAFGREGRPCAESRNDGRRAFAAWVERNQARFSFLVEGARVVCEWLAQAHGTRYALPHGPVVLLDAFDAVGERASLGPLSGLATAAALPLPHLIHDGGALAIDDALARLGHHGFHGALDPAEGLVWRVEARGRVVGVAKFVRAGKQDGCYLADHTGREPVPNTWHDLEAGCA
jgi:hypothetical protein